MPVTAWLIRSTHYPQAEGFANDVLNPPSEAEILSMYEERAPRE